MTNDKTRMNDQARMMNSLCFVIRNPFGIRASAFVILLTLVLDHSAFSQPQGGLVTFNDLGLRVARGFRVTLYADASLANDIYAMTLDSRGDVVVSSKGYIRTLYDTNGDGVADSSRQFAVTSTGGMGLCFDGNDLFFTGDGHFSRYTDADGNGIADGTPQQILPLAFSEHGGHAPRKGPDGWWYVIGGNDTGFDRRHVTIPGSPVQKPQAGAVVRVWPDLAGNTTAIQCEVIAHGFRNPYDFDFNWMGELFTYDSDVEGDYFLPWYTPTRIYHVAHGGHHGWQLQGYQRSWNRPDYYFDNVSVLAPMGRGSPTGLACYRHYQFPPRYRGALFALDWTFGRIYFIPLQAEGATYSGRPEVFLEPIGNQGFAPTDIAVGRDGSLYVSIGGRRTRGGVYRIDYPVAGNRALYESNWMYADSALEAVLGAPQPLDAWSRAWWVPRARNLGARAFADATMNGRLAPGARVRAVEILTELFGGLSEDLAQAGAGADSSFVRARVAWSLGRLSNRQFPSIISRLAADGDPLVRRCALEAVLDRVQEVGAQQVLEIAKANLAHPEKRIRQLAATLASGLPEAEWQAFWREASKAPPPSRLTAVSAFAWRGPLPQPAIVQEALLVLQQSKETDHRLQALRLIVLGLGDWKLTNASAEVYTAYETSASGASETAPLLEKVGSIVGPLLPSGDAAMDVEAARVLAIVRARPPEIKERIVKLITEQSSPTTDFHYLTVLSHLSGPPHTNRTKIAHAIVSLDRKLSGRQQRPKQNWTLRLGEVVEKMVQNDPALGDAILQQPDFVRPAHVPLAKALGPTRYLPAARVFAQAVKQKPAFEWSPLLVELLNVLPLEEARLLFRKQWANVALRDDLVSKLAENPDATDRDKFLAGLASSRADVVQASVRALMQLPNEQTGRALLPSVRLLRRLINEPEQAALRADVLALVNRESGESLQVREQANDADGLRQAYQPVFDWFRRKYPGFVAYLTDDRDDNPAQWNLVLRAVNWKGGDATRGAALFQQRGCQTCHSGSTPLGPDLGGVADRFSPADLFNAIIFPNRDVAPPYRTTTFQTRNGQALTGIVMFESADGVIVQTAASTTVRLATEEIVSRRPGTLSLMPNGLLAGLQSSQLADLYQYLKTLPVNLPTQ
jgi:putative membrane-bound dehydrogenase-like protein